MTLTRRYALSGLAAVLADRFYGHPTGDLDLIPVMNLFMVLIPFLLMGAAFFGTALARRSFTFARAGSSIRLVNSWGSFSRS